MPGVYKRDARYSVVSDDGEWLIRLIWDAPNWNRIHLTTREHAGMVARINQIKVEATRVRGGGFYIDEWGRVLIPTVGYKWFLGGTYGRALRFRYRDFDLQPCAPDEMRPGDRWDGPRVGIPYRLAEDDICRWCISSGYDAQVRVDLSHYIGHLSARQLAHRLIHAKGRTGRIYINQCKAFFAPIESSSGWYYRFLGTLGSDPWFPSPA